MTTRIFIGEHDAIEVIDHKGETLCLIEREIDRPETYRFDFNKAKKSDIITDYFEERPL